MQHCMSIVNTYTLYIGHTSTQVWTGCDFVAILLWLSDVETLKGTSNHSKRNISIPTKLVSYKANIATYPF